MKLELLIRRLKNYQADDLVCDAAVKYLEELQQHRAEKRQRDREPLKLMD